MTELVLGGGNPDHHVIRPYYVMHEPKHHEIIRLWHSRNIPAHSRNIQYHKTTNMTALTVGIEELLTPSDNHGEENLAW